MAVGGRAVPKLCRPASSAAGAGALFEVDALLLGAAAALRQQSQIKPHKRPAKAKSESETEKETSASLVR